MELERAGKEGCDCDCDESDDSDETVSHWRMRRREATDEDNDSGSSDGEERRQLVVTDRRAGTRFEDGLESLGGAPVDNDDVDAEVVEGEEKEEEEEDADVAMCEEKEREAFVVPTAGWFYVHDDRFAGPYSRSRNVCGGRSLKGMKEESKWKHDKFQEMWMNKNCNSNINSVWRTSYGYGNGSRQVHWKGQGRGDSVFPATTHGLRVVKGRGPVRYRANKSSHYMNMTMRNKKSELPKQTSHNSARVFPNSVMVGSDSYASRKQYFASNRKSVAQMHHSVSSFNTRSTAKKVDVPQRRTGGYVPSSALQDEPYSDPFQYWTSQSLETSLTWPMYMAQYPQMAQVQPYFQQFGLHSGIGFPHILEATSLSGTIQSGGTHLWPGVQLGDWHYGGFYDHSIDSGLWKNMSQLGIGSEPWQPFLGTNPGGLTTTCFSPYVTPDGKYCPRVFGTGSLC